VGNEEKRRGKSYDGARRRKEEDGRINNKSPKPTKKGGTTPKKD